MWEYKTIKLKTKGFVGGKLNEVELEKRMNEMGRLGWELCGEVDTNSDGGQTREVVIIFKRPLA